MQHDQLSAYAVRTDHLPYFMLPGQCSYSRSSGQSKHDFWGKVMQFPVSLGSSSPSRPGNVSLEGIPLPSSKGMREHGGDLRQEHSLANRSRTRLRVIGNGRIVRHCTDLLIYYDVISSFNCHFCSNSIWPHNNYKLHEFVLSQTWGLLKKTLSKKPKPNQPGFEYPCVQERNKIKTWGRKQAWSNFSSCETSTLIITMGKLQAGGAKQMYRSCASENSVSVNRE